MEIKESGVIMHITSLPSKYGIGGLGKEAYKFIDFIKECGFSYWEILPLEDVGFSNSPFQVITAFGLNPLLIDIDELIEEGLIDLTDHDYIIKEDSNFYSKETGEVYDVNKTVRETDLKNGSRIILI